MNWILAGLAAFLLGSLPWGLWIGRWVRGIDVRKHGSGNLGATNVYRVLGPAWGILVLLLDAGKGVGAVFLARAVAGQAGTHPGAESSAAAAWAGMIGLAASVLGHSFSPFARFRGGKGVATAAGAWGALAPLALAVALAAWIAVFAATRIVSAGSIAAAAILPVAVAFTGTRPAVDPANGGSGPHRIAEDPVFWLAVLTAVLLIARHRANLTRLLRREEKPLDLRGGVAAPRAEGGNHRTGRERSRP